MRETAVIEHRGCPLTYELGGKGPPVLLIQGVGVHGEGWRPQLDGLSEEYRCLTFDNRGIGRSRPMAARLSVEQMAEDARVLMDAAGWRSAHVIGHSLGGLVALELALTVPERVRSLALLCTSACGRDLGALSWWTISVGIRTRLGSRRRRRHAFLEMVMTEASLAGADRDALAESLVPIFGYDLARQPLMAMIQAAAGHAYDATDRLKNLPAVPTLVLSGDQDRMSPIHCGRALSAGIDGSRFVELPDAAHGLTIQLAPQVNRLLLDHLAAAEHESAA